MPREFELTHEMEVSATPEEAWAAIATGPGMDAWFMGHTEIEPREGGTTRLTVRGSTDEATVTAWEPPTRFASRSTPGPDGAFHAFDYTIEARQKGATAIRWVHSGVLGENWKAEYEAVSEGDPMYFDKLRVYLTYFQGRTATPVNVIGPAVPDREEAWRRFHVALGLANTVEVGDQVVLTPEGFPELSGEVDWTSRDFLGVRTADGIYRFFHVSAFGGWTGLGHHLFAEGLGQSETERAWERWLTGAMS
jgi:uncharacterized protein YndB with AHSA1/START domain